MSILVTTSILLKSAQVAYSKGLNLIKTDNNNEYCSGYSDKHGQWNNGFYCPKWGKPDQEYCCGVENHRYCCPKDDSPSTDSTRPSNVQAPLLVGLIVTSVLVLSVLIIIACYSCSCCLIYKRRKFRFTNGNNARQMSPAYNSGIPIEIRNQPPEMLVSNPPPYDDHKDAPPRYSAIDNCIMRSHPFFADQPQQLCISCNHTSNHIHACQCTGHGCSECLNRYATTHHTTTLQATAHQTTTHQATAQQNAPHHVTPHHHQTTAVDTVARNCQPMLHRQNDNDDDLMSHGDNNNDNIVSLALDEETRGDGEASRNGETGQNGETVRAGEDARHVSNRAPCIASDSVVSTHRAQQTCVTLSNVMTLDNSGPLSLFSVAANRGPRMVTEL